MVLLLLLLLWWLLWWLQRLLPDDFGPANSDVKLATTRFGMVSLRLKNAT
jgi:hypothetical protein